MIQLFDFDDLKKSRKSLLIFSISTLIFASVNLARNELSILGVSFIVSQDRIVALGRIATIILLAIYTLRATPAIVDFIKDSTVERIDKRHKINYQYLEFDIIGPPDEEEDYGPAADLNELHRKQNWEKEKIEKLFITTVNFLQAIAFVLLDFLFPIALGFICAIDPYILDTNLPIQVYPDSYVTSNGVSLSVKPKDLTGYHTELKFGSK